MRGSAKLVLLITAIGIVGMLVAYFVMPILVGEKQVSTSDARNIKGTIRIGVDNWIGYFPLCSPNLKRRMQAVGYLVQCDDDKADYASRFQKLKKGQLDFAVSTVDAYLLSGRDTDYPGVIVSVIDESKGGDAILARADTIDKLEDLKRGGLRIALTPASPSEFLLKSIAVHFDIKPLLATDPVANPHTLLPMDGASAALAALLDGSADVAVVWEPEVTRGLAKDGIKRLLSSRDTSQIIVDVLLASRKIADAQGDMTRLLLANYFRTLKHYRENPDQFQRDVQQETGLAQPAVVSMLKGVEWQTLSTNSKRWFGVAGQGEEALTNTIESVVSIYRSAGELQTHPLPDSNPYVIQNKSFIESLYQSGLKDRDTDSVQASFPPLDEQGWAALEEVGTLKIRPLSFQRGNNRLTDGSTGELEALAESLQHYPNFRVMIRGHTGLRGDADANKTLSQERADSVKRYLMDRFGLEDARLRAVGLGASTPLPRRRGESDRAYRYRLPRVELSLVADVY